MSNVSLDNDYIKEIKSSSEKLSSYLKDQENDKEKIDLLRRLGRLNNVQIKKPLLSLLDDPNKEIRYLSVKNLAKLTDESLIITFYHIAINDSSSLVRREAVSALGRLRHKKTIPYLIRLLYDDDPKIVMQAIRGLLVFKNEKSVIDEIMKLKNHPNEMIQYFIWAETQETDPSTKDDHSESSKLLQNCVINGDVLEIMKYIPENSIHLTFTSPPYYNARDYSIYPSYEYYLSFLEKVFLEVNRITKEGRFFILNTSPIIIPRISRKYSSKRYPIPYDIHSLLMKMGWEFIDDIIWLKPEASVKNRNAGFLQHRKPLAYKPNPVTEMLMVYRKMTSKLIDWNIHQYNDSIVEKSKVLGDYETTNVWRIDPTFDKNHSAVFPIELCNRVIKFYSMMGDLVFDPFAGSGTVGKSAINLQRRFLLTEIEKVYFETMKKDFLSGDFLLPNVTPVEGFTFLTMNKFIRRMQNGYDRDGS